MRLYHIFTSILVIILILSTICSSSYESHIIENMKNSTSSPITGFYNWTWQGANDCTNGNGNPTGSYNIGVLFGGEQADTAISTHLKDASKLANCDKKYLDLGGGNNKGAWSVDIVNKISPQLANLKNNGWDGLCFDIEVCSPNCDSSKSLSSALSKCFENCKTSGLDVMVTTNMNGPYDSSCDNCRDDILQTILTDTNIDYVSPQLYGSSGDKLPTGLTSSSLDKFKPLGNKVLLSIPKIFKSYKSCPDQNDWETVSKLFPWVGGYILWIHDGGDQPTPTKGNGVCGTSSTTIDCSKKCPNGTDSECPSGQHCYANIPKCATNWCGKDWSDASQNCNKTADNKPCWSGVDSDCSDGYHCYANIDCKNF